MSTTIAALASLDNTALLALVSEPPPTVNRVIEILDGHWVDGENRRRAIEDAQRAVLLHLHALREAARRGVT